MWGSNENRCDAKIKITKYETVPELVLHARVVQVQILTRCLIQHLLKTI